MGMTLADPVARNLGDIAPSRFAGIDLEGYFTIDADWIVPALPRGSCRRTNSRTLRRRGAYSSRAARVRANRSRHRSVRLRRSARSRHCDGRYVLA